MTRGEPRESVVGLLEERLEGVEAQHAVLTQMLSRTILLLRAAEALLRDVEATLAAPDAAALAYVERIRTEELERVARLFDGTTDAWTNGASVAAAIRRHRRVV